MATQSTLELAELVELLRRSEVYPHPVDEVRVIQTHISCVLLAGGYAYKLKKPVDFGFLDFRTLDQRRHFCQREVELNSRLSPGLYLGVVPIVLDRTGVRVAASGSPAPSQTGQGGEVVEYAVKMRRLPAEKMMDALVDSGHLPEGKVRQLADRIAQFHQSAPGGPGVARFGFPTEIARAWSQNLEQSRAFVGVTHTWAQRRLLAEYVRASLVRNDPLFIERVRANRIREGHGDLRTSAVCFDSTCPGGMCIFDCIEFNRSFRCCDVASDIAFLAMDLELHGRPDLARVFVDQYATASGDEGVLRLLPFYGCYRAYVRGKVEGFKFREHEVSARDRAESLVVACKAFALACRFADRDRPPLLLLMSGLSATGKTTLARAIVAQRPFEVLSSDVVRKELAGLEASEQRVGAFGAGLYSPERKQAVYEELYRRAAVALESGRSVILDATFGEKAQRERAVALAGEQGAYFFCVECRVSEENVRDRMEERERTGGASDARFATYLRQRDVFESLDELEPWCHIEVDTSESLDASLGFVLAALDDRLRPAELLPEPHLFRPSFAGQ